VKKSYPLSQVFRLVEAGPIMLVSTRAKGPAGRPNIQTIAWHAMIDFYPPIVGCVLAGEVTSANLKATRECVLNIPTRAIARKAVKCGTVSGRRTDKFGTFGLTPAPAAKPTWESRVNLPAGRNEGPAAKNGRHFLSGKRYFASSGNSQVVSVCELVPDTEFPSGDKTDVIVERISRCSALNSNAQSPGNWYSILTPRIAFREPGSAV